MSYAFRFDPPVLPEGAEKLRQEVRDFLKRSADDGIWDPVKSALGETYNREFARAVAKQGWIGMTWPKKYGGRERSFLERFVVTEEMLAANAPVSAYRTADRQSGPVLMRYGQDAVKMDILPRICRGELAFAIGLSEPNSGSDLFAASTKATKVDGGWKVTGRKIWTSNAHRADYIIALLRTSPPTSDNRRHGLTQFLVDMKTPGISTRPIINLTGAHEFNEVVFDDAFFADVNVIGEVDGAWKQATSELAYERSGPERFMETIAVLREGVRVMGAEPSERQAEGIGREVAGLATLRRMSLSVAAMLEDGKFPTNEAAVVKDVGTNYEQALPNRIRQLVPPGSPQRTNVAEFEKVMAFTTMIAPKLTIQGGTREVLRGIIARGLGLR